MKLLDFLEYVGAWLLLALLRRLRPVAASNLAGGLARVLGPLLPVSRVAGRNLRAAMPGLGGAERRRLIRAVWENLGRTVGELPHLAALEITAEGPGFAVEGAEHLRPGPAIYVSAHYGNWEALPVIVARSGHVFSSFYRAARNTRVDALIQTLRLGALRRAVPMFPKGAAGARGAVAHLAAGGAIGMLLDQKLNDGIAVPFLGLPAMTAPAAAAFALRYRYPVIPGRIEREAPARLRLIVEAPLDLPDSGDREADIRTLTGAINARFGAWITANPGAWLWLHRRWAKETVAAALARKSATPESRTENDERAVITGK
jgi:KDO2-lipid IV(A) lauroyltransferase